MGFYEEIARYYDLIFPVGKEQISCLTAAAGAPPKAVLDIACGTGGYAIELAERGYSVTAVDLDPKMIEALRLKLASRDLDIIARQGNMLELSGILQTKYDLAFCIGNSLAHLAGEAEVAAFFREARKLLTAAGKLIIQIVNYDRILAKDIRSLSDISREEAGLVFKRMYLYDSNLNKVRFRTVLAVGGQVIENETPLYPVLADAVVRLLREAEFGQVRVYGDFRGNEYDKMDSPALVVIAS